MMSKKRKFNGKVYELVSNKLGTNSREAQKLKKEYKEYGHNVRVIIATDHPYIYPEGRYFVYVRAKK